VLLTSLRGREDQTRRVIARINETDVSPRLIGPDVSGFVEVQKGISEARYALGRLRTGAETTEKLGSTAPTMKADLLHPDIWDAAEKRWVAGHYSDAVQRAASALNASVQNLVSRYDVSDSDLMAQAFSLSPPEAGKPRIRWPGDDTDLTVKSMRSGILSFSQGIFKAIRNPATHLTTEIPKQDALEQLAALSTLARWIDRCRVVHGPDVSASS